MVSERAIVWSHPRLVSQETVKRHLEDMDNVTNFIKFILWDPEIVPGGYGKSVTKDRYAILNSFKTNGFGLHLNAVNMAYYYESLSDEREPKRIRLDNMEGIDDEMFWDSLEDVWELEDMDDISDDLIHSAVLSTQRDRHPYLFRSAGGVSTMMHPDALAHFNTFSHTESIIVEARNWTTGFGREFEVIDRDYMGIDLGELLTYSAVVMNPAKSDQIRSHSRSHGYLMEPLKRYQRWLKSYKTNAIYASERTMTGSNSMDPAIFREYAIHRLTSKHGSRLSAFYNRRIMKYRKWQLKLASKKVMDSSVEELLKIIGCSSGKRWNFNNGIGPVIGVGLGQFRFHQNSVHAKFAKYLTQKARAIGIVVVGANEYYTSQKCPRCLSRLYEVDQRVKYCEECRMFLNRDNAAAQNISTLVIIRANKQPRPPQLMEPSDAELGIPPPDPDIGQQEGP